MATPGTQATGRTSEVAYNTTPAAGFYGWSPDGSPDVYRVTGGIHKGTYATLTAYNVGETVVYGGNVYRAVAAVGSGNTTAPVVGATWVDASSHRGPVESLTTSHPQYYR